MADAAILAILRQGADTWNAWRRAEPYRGTSVDLTECNLAGLDLRGVQLPTALLGGSNLSGADLTGANLGRAYLQYADLSKATLVGADLTEAVINGANLAEANLTRACLMAVYGVEANFADANLGAAHFFGANLTNCNLRGVSLYGSTLMETELEGADMTGAKVYGLSAWNLGLHRTKQDDLLITRSFEDAITVDSLEIAQFIYLLLHNSRIRQVIDSITSKVVLLLGRFTPERKVVLDALRNELRRRGWVPVLFDFDKPASKDLSGTVQTLASMSRFIIADLTDPSCIPHELAMIAPNVVIPIQPLLLDGQHEYAMFVDLKERYHWVLKPYRYKSLESLLKELPHQVIAPAEAKASELRKMN